jgi:ribosomal protein S18 acetylase RimI-like enzyme
MAHVIASLVWATDIDVLASDRTLERRDGYWVVQSPSNPTFWWGNFLLFDEAPAVGDGERWEALFAQEFAARPEVSHCTLAWDRVDGERGHAQEELVARGFELEWNCGLIARPQELIEHERANRDVEIRALDPAGDECLWEAVIDIQVAGEPELFGGTAYHLGFLRARQAELRDRFSTAECGAWYVGLLDGVVTSSLGVVVTERRARFQAVETASPYRRRGIAGRLVFDAARDAAAKGQIDHFVIVADPDYHAIGIYEGLGFERAELVVGALRKPARS